MSLPGSGDASAKTSCAIPDSSLLLFEVKDTGPGITADHIEAIFEPFEQVQETRAALEGVGLGLTISQRLARMMDSQIQVESTSRVGSRFWFEVELPQEEQPENIPPRPSPTIIGIKGSSPKVLLVDDEPDSLGMLRECLEPLGFQTRLAAAGEDALLKAKEWLPDMIVFDLKLPRMSGYDLIRQIRQFPNFQTIKLIAVSASVYEATRCKSFADGCDAFISKPVQFDRLLDTIGQLLPIEWLYDEEPLSTARDSDALQGTLPPTAELRRLFEFARKGLVLDIRRWLDRMEQGDKHYQPFLTCIRQFTSQFQFEELCDLLKPYMEEPHER